jgi:hypothetical protein
LLAAIQAAIGPAMTPTLTASSDGSDGFEAYTLGLVLEAARAEGAVVTYENVDTSVTPTFTFRTSPGQIWWSGQPYTHAIIRFPGKPSLEAHLGIYITGNSSVMHEADVSVIFRDEGIACRQNQSTPRASKVVLATECKFYSSTLKLHLARSFLGLCQDMTGRECFFVTNTAAISVEKLLAHKRKKWEHQIVPAATNDVTRLRNLYQDVFKNFKTRN